MQNHINRYQLSRTMLKYVQSSSESFLHISPVYVVLALAKEAPMCLFLQRIENGNICKHFPPDIILVIFSRALVTLCINHSRSTVLFTCPVNVQLHVVDPQFFCKEASNPCIINPQRRGSLSFIGKPFSSCRCCHIHPSRAIWGVDRASLESVWWV